MIIDMLKNVSYNNENIKNEISDLIGEPYSLIEKIKKGGIEFKQNFDNQS